MEIEVNEFQTPINDELLSLYPEEVLELFIDFVTNVPFIRNLISPNRPKAKDLPRDSKGRIIINLENPHIIEDADYFRLPALHFAEHGCYTFLKPNSNPLSLYRKFWDEEIRRCLEGYVRESDGEWITGYMYWFLNYNPMMVNIIQPGTKRAIRKEGFPFFFEGIYWRFHYLEMARNAGKHAIELAKRGCAKSYTLSSMMTHNLLIGLNNESRRRVITTLVAYQKEYLKDDKDGTFSKFKPALNFLRSNTPFPRLMLKNSPNEMSWQMGYKDDLGIEKGSFNSVIGVSAKDDSDKCRGKRSDFYIEEMGTFSGLLAFYDTIRKGVEDGDYAFNLIFLVGTANESESDFSSAKTLLYSPDGYNIYSINNVYDKPKQGKARFGYFFPSYINRAGCFNVNGVSDVVKAILEILMARYKAKYSADPKSVLRVIAEDPITPAEAIIKVKAAYFPVAALGERLLQLDSNPNTYDDVYVGTLVQTGGKIEFKNTADIPIRSYNVPNNTLGALEIYQMPVEKRNGEVYENRYIIGHDPVDNDQAESNSLSSTFVFDLFTDKIVAEYTGRHPFADDNFEMVRKLCLFYNAKCLYEAHPYTQQVYTPSGKKLWGDIKIGDYLFSPNGNPVKVKDIPVDCKMPIYKLKLADGRVVECSDNHIWIVYDREAKKDIEITTNEIMHLGLKNKYELYRFFIPLSKTVLYQHKDLPIAPYTLGLLLMLDLLNALIYTSINNIQFYKSTIPYKTKFIRDKCTTQIIIDNYSLKLSELDLDNKLIIPEIYKQSDYRQRFELLKGIMDSKGCPGTYSASVLIIYSLELVEDIISLCRSLGLKAWYCRSYGNSYKISIASASKIFKLRDKKSELYVYNKTSTMMMRTAIESIEFDRYDMGKCVTVESLDGLYLIGDYIVTHNCNKKGLYAYMAKMNSVHLLADTPEYLRDMLLVKYNSFGSNRKGVNASSSINNFANELIRDWLLKLVPTIEKDELGNTYETTIPNLFTLKNRALIEELIAFQPEVNVDRIRSLGMVMLYRQEKIILYQGNLNPEAQDRVESDYLGKDDFFERNYDRRFLNNSFYLK